MCVHAAEFSFADPLVIEAPADACFALNFTACFFETSVSRLIGCVFAEWYLAHVMLCASLLSADAFAGASSAVKIPAKRASDALVEVLPRLRLCHRPGRGPSAPAIDFVAQFLRHNVEGIEKQMVLQAARYRDLRLRLCGVTHCVPHYRLWCGRIDSFKCK